MKKCMFCDREHDNLYGGRIKFCEHCKNEMDLVSAKVMIKLRQEELQTK